MNVPTWTKPAIWGAVGGAIAAIVVGFAWGGWVTGGTAQTMKATSAESAIVHAFTPICVQRAQDEPEQVAKLKEERSYRQDDFVIEAGWVDNVSEKHRTEVSRACADAIVAAME